MHFALDKRSDIDVLGIPRRNLSERALAMHFVFHPLTLLLITVGKDILSKAMPLIVARQAHVAIAIIPGINTGAMGLPVAVNVAHVALVLRAIDLAVDELELLLLHHGPRSVDRFGYRSRV